MQPLTSYTDTDAVRAVIGVTDNEISDAMLTQRNAALELTVDLGKWLPTHATIFSEGSTGTPSAEQLLKKQYLQLYAQYFCAALMLRHMELAIPQAIGDGKSELKRFQGTDIPKLLLAVTGGATAYKAALQEEVNGATVATAASFVSAGKPDYDPVGGP